jgi:hypothetical protein
VNTAEQAEYEAVIDAEVEAAPPLRPEQVAKLCVLFDRPGINGGDAA